MILLCSALDAQRATMPLAILLLIIYFVFIRNLRVLVLNDLGSVIRQRFRRLNPNLETEMLAMAIMTMMCTAGIAFYVRFLLALCKECKPR
jgi:hypothetical protein